MLINSEFLTWGIMRYVNSQNAYRNIPYEQCKLNDSISNSNNLDNSTYSTNRSEHLHS